jgi:hypothetical protein
VSGIDEDRTAGGSACIWVAAPAPLVAEAVAAVRHRGAATVTEPVNLTADHAPLDETFAARRYFRKFERITQHLARVAAEMERDGNLTREDAGILGGYVARISATFRALSLKYLMAGRETGAMLGALTIDKVESGFPVHSELLTLANDTLQAGNHLTGLPARDTLIDRMVGQIVGDLVVPARLQFALSQRLYYEALATGALFYARNDPQALFLAEDKGRRRYLVHWAVYDSRVNLPAIYLMEVEDTGRRALPADAARWPEAQAHLMAQSMGALKLLTIAQGFDRDFDALHPKRLRRFHVGPMYSSAFTLQSGPIREVLEEAHAPEGEDWALAWTVETLESERAEAERAGWFGTVERQIFALDPFSGRGADTGATRTERAIILPERAFQVLAEKRPPGFSTVRKFVVGAGGRVLSHV